jgi:hypothetical protein
VKFLPEFSNGAQGQIVLEDHCIASVFRTIAHHVEHLAVIACQLNVPAVGS